MTSLPIEAILSELRNTLREFPAVILRAEPGAGKTTRVPLALLDEPWLAGKRILMLEPRRLAAGNAARYMAELTGSPVGETVGFRVRYRSRVSRRTRIEVVTEGILTRRLQDDPELQGVGLVIFDEFHERNLQSDLALALCREVQSGLREDLKLLIMSATLEAAPLVEMLDDAPLIDCPGREHPIRLHHLQRVPAGRRLDAMPALVRRAVTETAGDVLVFLPGTADIRRLQGQLKDWAENNDLLLVPLYGGLDYAAQERAIRPAGKRKLVLATNIAETSLTIDGVRTVVDSGFERRPRFDPAAGVTRLETVRISLASARQRAGRAGRLGPGDCYRLWSEAEEGALLPAAPAEIRQADLAPLLLELAGWGVRDPSQLAWLDPPGTSALEAARRLLLQLRALDERGRVTPIGRRMAGFGCHPRLARLLVDALDLDCPATGSALVALLSERDALGERVSGDGRGGCDLCERLAWLRSRDADRRWPPLTRAFQFWLDRCGTSRVRLQIDSRQVALLLAKAFPDRIARRRAGTERRYLLSGGQGALLAESSQAGGAEWLVAVDIQGQSGEGLIRLASSLAEDQVLGLLGDDTPWRAEVEWDDRRQRLQAREVRRIGELRVQQRPFKPRSEQVLAALLEAVRRRGIETLGWTPPARQLLARMRLVADVLSPPGWPELTDERLLGQLDEWLGPYLSGVSSIAALQRVDLVPPLRALLDFRSLRQLDRWVPVRLKVPSGRDVQLDYLAGETPVLAVKLQELFGQAQTPRLAEGRIVVQVHLLSPAGRPLQVTGDLASFWNDVYPEVRKEMLGRYPKHPWPEDPLNAEATGRVKRPSRR
ncbi:ATP-dependent helicase HrpB [Geothermobacter hydrogeniphilus]|uniref:ATP-dependent helicase HrpB n=1 Tax=Geothermobacter hydrogeniphilus TaxID=1969733 RepID=A0A2K2HBU9_9BACT|nr:ATP-dependent helicase HrpB [Geothermobacter hydrogeniphilus]PNU20785.1 ATP-dependent helicase HrpB [Geothermobacter hydrogeniphilus]